MALSALSPAKTWAAAIIEKPERKNKMSVVIDSSRCVGCGLCIEICPTHALVNHKSKTLFRSEKCNSCGTCERICICSALTFTR